MDPERAFQKDFVSRLDEATIGVPSKAVAEAIGISTGTLSKRRLGISAFTAYEMCRLAERFGVSLTTTPAPDTARFVFEADTAHARGLDPERYLARLEGAIAEAGGELDSAQLTIATTDIPLLWLLGEPDLVAAKLYAFTVAAATRVPEPLDLDALPSTWAARAAAVAEAHERVASVEVWGTRPLLAFLQDVERLALARCLDAVAVERIAAAIARVVERMFEAAAESRKAGGGAFELYTNGAHSSSPILGLRTGVYRAVHLTLDYPHAMSAYGPGAYAYLERYVSRLRAQATRVSGVGQANSRALRAELLKRIGDRRARALGLLEMAEATPL